MDDLNLEIANLLCANCAEVDIRNVGNLVRCDGLGCLVNFVGDAFGRRRTVGEVVFDAKVFLGTSWVVTGRQQDTTCSLSYPDDVAGSWGAEDAILAD